MAGETATVGELVVAQHYRTLGDEARKMLRQIIEGDYAYVMGKLDGRTYYAYKIDVDADGTLWLDFSESP